MRLPLPRASCDIGSVTNTRVDPYSAARVEASPQIPHGLRGPWTETFFEHHRLGPGWRPARMIRTPELARLRSWGLVLVSPPPIRSPQHSWGTWVGTTAGWRGIVLA